MPSLIFKFNSEIAVKPMPRPRVFKTHTFQFRQTNLINAMKSEINVRDIDYNIQLGICFRFKDRRRRDIDNCLKTVFDCLMFAKIIKDDSQIMVVNASKEIGIEDGCHIYCYSH